MIIEVLGWIFQIRAYKRKHPEPNIGIRSTLMSDGCKLATDGRYFYLTDTDGRTLPKQLACTIIDRINEPTKAIIELHIAGMTEYKGIPDANPKP